MKGKRKKKKKNAKAEDLTIDAGLVNEILNK